MSRDGDDLSRARNCCLSPFCFCAGPGGAQRCFTLPFAHAPSALYHRRMEREVILVRDGAAVWRGFVKAPSSSTPASARDYLDLAWRKALEEGAVTADDSGRVQFRFP